MGSWSLVNTASALEAVAELTDLLVADRGDAGGAGCTGEVTDEPGEVIADVLVSGLNLDPGTVEGIAEVVAGVETGLRTARSVNGSTEAIDRALDVVAAVRAQFDQQNVAACRRDGEPPLMAARVYHAATRPDRTPVFSTAALARFGRIARAAARDISLLVAFDELTLGQVLTVDRSLARFARFFDLVASMADPEPERDVPRHEIIRACRLLGEACAETIAAPRALATLDRVLANIAAVSDDPAIFTDALELVEVMRAPYVAAGVVADMGGSTRRESVEVGWEIAPMLAAQVGQRACEAARCALNPLPYYALRLEGRLNRAQARLDVTRAAVTAA